MIRSDFLCLKLLKSKNINFYFDDFMKYCTLKGSYQSTIILFIKYLEEGILNNLY